MQLHASTTGRSGEPQRIMPVLALLPGWLFDADLAEPWCSARGALRDAVPAGGLWVETCCSSFAVVGMAAQVKTQGEVAVVLAKSPAVFLIVLLKPAACVLKLVAPSVAICTASHVCKCVRHHLALCAVKWLVNRNEQNALSAHQQTRS